MYFHGHTWEEGQEWVDSTIEMGLCFNHVNNKYLSVPKISRIISIGESVGKMLVLTGFHCIFPLLNTWV